MNNDCTEVDELLLQIADYKNDLTNFLCKKEKMQVTCPASPLALLLPSIGRR